MAETLWDAITRRATDFIEGGQERRQWLDDLGRKAEYYVPPELRNILGFVAEATPTAAIDRAAQAGGEMLAPGRTPMQRLGSAGQMLSETAGVVAPAMVANRAAMPAAQAIQESLLGASMAADDVGRRFVERMNQPGPVPTMYSNPVGRAAGDAPKGILAYHGSPHDFDRFSMSKIGTGEGAQAYGHGLYFAENTDIARGYRDNVFGAAPREMFESDEAHRIVNDQLQSFGATPNALEGAIDDLRKSLKSAEGSQKIWGDQQPRVDALKEAIGFLENKADTRLMVGDKTVYDIYDSISSRADRMPAKAAEAEYNKMAILEDLMNDGDVLGVMHRAGEGAYDPSALAWFEKEIAPKFKRQGRLYEINIRANPDDFLDWDKPLSEQPSILRRLGLSDRTENEINAEAVRLMEEGNAKAGRPGGWMDDPEISARITALNDEINNLAPSVSGESFYRSGGQGGVADLMSQLGSGSPQMRSQELLEAGIPGIKYLDAGSRGAGEGSRNYVVFDENLIDIVRKYGIAGAALMLGMSQADLAQAMQAQQPKGLLSQQEQEVQ